MHEDEKDITQRPSENSERTFEPKPRKVDAKTFGPWIVKRDRKVFDMLEEYDRRQEKRRIQRR